MTQRQWIGDKLKEGLTTSQLYNMYKVFIKETGATTSYDNYRTLVRKVNRASAPTPKIDNVKFSKEVDGDKTTVVTTSTEIKTLEDLISYAKIDLKKFKVDKHIINSWVTWSTRLGEKIPLENYQVKAWVSPIENTDEETDSEYFEKLIEDAKNYAPRYPKLDIAPKKSGNALEISLFDHHFGQLSWGKETGDRNYNLKDAAKLALQAVEDILNKAQHYDIEQIFFPIGNDFFNVNDKTNTTAKGTPQSEDDRWQKTYTTGREVWVSILELCRSVAPVMAFWIPGNHDEERSFYLCDALYCWFHNSDIEIDNSPKAQKVVEWGNNAVMYSHGCNERPNDYPSVFATTFPLQYSRAKYRAIHLGDKHHTKKSSLTPNEDVYSIDVKIKPSLVPLNAWSAGKAYRAIARTEAEVWNKKDGLIADLYYNV